MNKSLIVILLAASALSGCGEMVNKAALSDAQEKCASKGLQFVKTDDQRVDVLVAGEDHVKGVCVGPDDPRYVKGQ